MYNKYTLFVEGDMDQKITKAAEKTQRHKLSASAMQGLREEYMDTPTEIAEFSANGARMKMAQERQERIESVILLWSQNLDLLSFFFIFRFDLIF